jgi:hypothetical protein
MRMGLKIYLFVKRSYTFQTGHNHHGSQGNMKKFFRPYNLGYDEKK